MENPDGDRKDIVGDPWLLRDQAGEVHGSTGYESSAAGGDVLIRSVAVDGSSRGQGKGSRLARFALNEARRSGVQRAWLFSRRSGPFWEGLGFERADRYELAERLAETHQVRLFRSTGQLNNEVAWCRDLIDHDNLGAPLRRAEDVSATDAAQAQ